MGIESGSGRKWADICNWKVAMNAYIPSTQEAKPGQKNQKFKASLRNSETVFFFFKKKKELSMLTYICDPSTWEWRMKRQEVHDHKSQMKATLVYTSHFMH